MTFEHNGFQVIQWYSRSCINMFVRKTESCLEHPSEISSQYKVWEGNSI